jgi:hypothetical protein
MLPSKMQARKPSTRFVGRPGQEGGPLGVAQHYLSLEVVWEGGTSENEHDMGYCRTRIN